MSTTDPDARTYRRSHNTASILFYQGHVRMENRVFGFSRPSFYQAQAAFEQSGLAGLMAQKPGPRSGLKLTIPNASNRALTELVAAENLARPDGSRVVISHR